MKMRSLSVVGLCLFLTVGLSWEVGAYNERDLKKAKSTQQCTGCNLSGADLSGLDLRNKNFTGSDLSGSNLQNSDLTTYHGLKDVNLSNADLRGTNLYDIGRDPKTSITSLDGVIIDSATYLNWEPIQPISLEEGLGPFFDIVLPFWVKEGEKNRKLNLGFKDIRLGMTLGEFKDLGVCDDKNTWRTCYNNTKVYIYTSNGVTDDRSPIIWIQVKLDDYTDETFQKFLGIFSKKYEETYSFTENDRELFNSNNDDAQLYVLFENGKVGLKINRWKNSLSLHALYQNETESEILMKDVVPTKIKSDDY